MNVINFYFKNKMDDKSTLVRLPLFKVELKTKENNWLIFDILTLCQYFVTFEPPKKASGVPQCIRFQDWGHTKNYCMKTARCIKCGERHLFKDCQSPKTIPSKCANCNDNHTANYKGCKYFQSKLSSIKC